MTIKELEEKVSLVNLIEKDYKIKRVGKTLRVDLCPICGSKNHFTIYPVTNSYSSFNDCCTGGSVYKYLQEVKGMSEDEAFKELMALGGVTEYKKSITNSIPLKEIEKVIPLKNYTKTVIELYNKQTEQDKEYFINRGLTNEIIDKYKLFIGNIKGYGGARATIPIWKEGQVVFYNARALTKKQEEDRKYDKADTIATMFNIDYLKNTTKGDVIVLCEGEFDALSMEAIGYKAIATGGTQFTDILIKTISDIPSTKDIIFLTAFDNDISGNKASAKMDYKKIDIPTQYNDINEWFIDDISGFKCNINKQIQILIEMVQSQAESEINVYKNTSASSYIDTFISGINESINTPAMATGFKDLDMVLDDGLYDGLYIIGAISSLGKTSWLLQICDQIANQGQDVLYFSLEMSKAELIAKSISRLTFLNAKNKSEAKTTRGILSGKRQGDYSIFEKELINKSIKQYTQYADHLYISEGLGSIGVEQITQSVKKHIEITGVKPLVVIDYLQILAPFDMRSSDKQNTDKAVFQLKQLSRDYKIPVVAISSLNRASYSNEINMAAFKESGAVEYSSDVLLGLQFQRQSDSNFDVDAEKAKEKREIEVKILKNRNGATGGTIKFDYYCLFNHFIETGMKNKKEVVQKR